MKKRGEFRRRETRNREREREIHYSRLFFHEGTLTFLRPKISPVSRKKKEEERFPLFFPPRFIPRFSGFPCDIAIVSGRIRVKSNFYSTRGTRWEHAPPVFVTRGGNSKRVRVYAITPGWLGLFSKFQPQSALSCSPYNALQLLSFFVDSPRFSSVKRRDRVRIIGGPRSSYPPYPRPLLPPVAAGQTC